MPNVTLYLPKTDRAFVKKHKLSPSKLLQEKISEIRGKLKKGELEK